MFLSSIVVSLLLVCFGAVDDESTICLPSPATVRSATGVELMFVSTRSASLSHPQINPKLPCFFCYNKLPDLHPSHPKIPLFQQFSHQDSEPAMRSIASAHSSSGSSSIGGDFINTMLAPVANLAFGACAKASRIGVGGTINLQSHGGPRHSIYSASTVAAETGGGMPALVGSRAVDGTRHAPEAVMGRAAAMELLVS